MAEPRRSARLRPPSGFALPPETAQQLAPLFEMLSVVDLCRLACCSTEWSATLDAWRSEEVEVPGIEAALPAWTREKGEMQHLGFRDHAWGATVRAQTRFVKMLARKYPKLQTLALPTLSPSSLTALTKNCRSLQSIDLGGMPAARSPSTFAQLPTSSPELLIKLAKKAPQLRVVRVEPLRNESTGEWWRSATRIQPGFPVARYNGCNIPIVFEEPELVMLAQACPHLEELRCQVGEAQPLTSQGLLAIATACPALRHLELCGHDLPTGELAAVSSDALLRFVQACPQLTFLDVDRMKLNKSTVHQIEQVRPGIQVKSSWLHVYLRCPACNVKMQAETSVGARHFSTTCTGCKQTFTMEIPQGDGSPDAYFA